MGIWELSWIPTLLFVFHPFHSPFPSFHLNQGTQTRSLFLHRTSLRSALQVLSYLSHLFSDPDLLLSIRHDFVSRSSSSFFIYQNRFKCFWTRFQVLVVCGSNFFFFFYLEVVRTAFLFRRISSETQRSIYIFLDLVWLVEGQAFLNKYFVCSWRILKSQKCLCRQLLLQI